MSPLRRASKSNEMAIDMLIVSDERQFAKGRVEYLIQHLLKKCPNVTDLDRNAILLQMQETALAGPPKTPNKSLQKLGVDPNQYAVVDTGSSSTLERQQSALDTLAEVSRHHLDYSVQRQVPLDTTHFHESDQDLAEQALWAQLQQHTIGLAPQGDSSAFDIPTSHQPHDATYIAERLVQNAQEQQQNFSPSQSQYPLHFTQLDPQLGHASTPFASHMPDATFAETNVGGDENNGPQQNIAKHVFVKHNLESYPTTRSGDTPNGHTSQLKTRARVRFTESRRREVQEIRKRGACIRCRMLKKPCSEGTPCKTCANVDVARLWKGRCLRTKLSDEFLAWNAGFFTALSASHISQLTLEELPILPLNLQVALFAESLDNSMTFPVTVQHQQHSGHATASYTHESDHASAEQVIIIDSGENYALQLAKLCITSYALNHFVSQESSSLIATTIEEARSLCGMDSDEVGEAFDLSMRNGQIKSDTRACYNLANELLYNTVHLWALTNILVTWRSTSDSVAPILSVKLQGDSVHGMTDESMHSLTDANRAWVQLQLFSLLEKKAAKLGKTVMTDLERHLLQRQQVNSYATFLTAILLLDGVEKMTAFYHAYDTEAGLHDQTSSSELITRVHWPLPSPPMAIWAQGPSFAQLLQTLLRMRGLPPRTFEDELGMLAVRQESSDSISKINGSVSEAHLKAQDEQRREALTLWLRKCDVSASQVKDWLNQEHGWHGKFIAGTLVEDSQAVG